MNKTKIDWPGLTHTWNPIVGCKHGCAFENDSAKGECYAKRMNDRFKWIDNWEEPQLMAKRLEGPLLERKPAKIFVGSMCDLFGEWVPSHMIQYILDVCSEADWHEYMFLTKNPFRYSDFKFSSNMWIGATVTDNSNVDFGRFYYLSLIKTEGKRFLSIEPFLKPITGCDFHNIDLLIIGGLTGPKPFKPPVDWINELYHDNIHIKENAL